MRGLAARVPHAPHIAVPRQTLLGATLTTAPNRPPSNAVLKAHGSRWEPGCFCSALLCCEFLLFASSNAPVRWSPVSDRGGSIFWRGGGEEASRGYCTRGGI